MPTDDTREVLRNIDRRLQHVEQVLPTLATKEELKAAIAPLATKEEVREEGERSRRYTKVLIEQVNDSIKLLAENIVARDERNLREHDEMRENHASLEHRVTTLEAKRPRRRG